MPSSFPRWLPLAGLLLLAGCDREEIATYKVPKPPPPVLEEKVRLLAAVLEDGKDQWFFKLVGPIDEVKTHGEAFAKFVESVRFTGKKDNPVEWKPPASWQKGPSSDLRFATFYPDPKDRAIELTVFKFDMISPILANVNRWCDRDLGRKHIREAELKQYTRKFQAGKNEGVLVDMTGPGARKGKHPPMGGMEKRKPPADGTPRPPKALPIAYKTPDGWTETGPRGGFVPILTAFDVGGKAETTVIVMGGGTGGELDNVNRWRGQVGLGPTTAAELAKGPPREVKVGGEAGKYYDLSGPQKGMLLVVLKRGGRTWYLKLFGEADTVGKNRGKFESFVQSIQFTGAADE